MGSGIEKNDSMFYFGDVPWHGLGKPVDHVLTAKDALEEAGIDWHVIKVPLQTGDYDDGEIVIPGGIETGRYATIRTDTKDVLGDVGEVYEPIQNAEAFDFFDSIVGEKEAKYHTAGSLFSGRKVWILAKLPDYIQIEGTDDVTEEYMMLTNSHDGTSAVFMGITPVRIVCNNTLQAALRGLKNSYSVRHTGNSAEKIKEARQALGIAKNYYHELNDVLNGFAKYQVSSEQVEEFTKFMFPSKVKINEELEEEIITSKQSADKRDKLVELFETGAGNELVGIAGTAYAMFNSATEFADHIAYSRITEGSDPDSLRMNRCLFGSGSTWKGKAFSYINDLVNNN